MHIAIIMDGNGRWATRRHRPRAAGHAEGARAVRRVVEAAARAGVRTLTLYAFSGDNWRRPASEVAALMSLFRRYLITETERCVANDIRLTILGRRDRLPVPLVRAIEAAERATEAGERMRLRIAIDYSARDAILRAARLETPDALASRNAFAARLGAVDHAGGAAEDVDLLIRTGGERRLSDFLLWECAYAELHFVDRMWPDFDEADLLAAVEEFRRRERRFGALPESAAS